MFVCCVLCVVCCVLCVVCCSDWCVLCGWAHLVEEHAGQAREQTGVGALHQQVRHVGGAAREEHKRLENNRGAGTLPRRKE